MGEKRYKDEWGTGAREGYEDRGKFLPPRSRSKEPGSPLLSILGGLAMVGGICWGVYLATSSGDALGAMQQNHGPIAIIALGVVASVVGKYLRA
jgi:hypothetical protein